MLFGSATTLETILDAIAARAASASGLSTVYCFASLDLGDMEAQGGPQDSFIVVTNPRFTAVAEAVTSGGTDTMLWDGTVEVVYWNRFEVDEPYRDSQNLRDQTYGILAKWRALRKVNVGLQLFAPTPVGNANLSILAEPMRVVDFDIRPRLPKSGWTKLASRWNVKWREDLT